MSKFNFSWKIENSIVLDNKATYFTVTLHKITIF